MLTVTQSAARQLHRVAPLTVDRAEQMAGKVEEISFPFECFPWQMEFLQDETRVVAAIGGIGSGKTWALARWCVLEMMYEAGTGTLGGIFANSYQQLDQTTLPHLFSFLEEIGMEYGDDYVYNEKPPRRWAGFVSKFKKHAGILSCRPWGQAIVRSLDNYQLIRGIELGWAAMDEARDTKHDAYKVIQGRVRCSKAKRQRLRITTSPNGYDWLYELFVDKIDKSRGRRKLIQMQTRDNTTLPDDYIADLTESYDPLFAEQELKGKFVSLTRGQVYRNFDRTRHVKTFNWNPEWDWQVCFDFNRTPYSVSLCQTDHLTNTVWVYDEVVMENADTAAVCSEIIHNRLAGKMPTGRVVQVYGDASGSHKDTRSNLSDYDIITQYFGQNFGNRFESKWNRTNPSVMHRINSVNAMLLNAAGNTRLYIHQRCEALRRDMERVTFLAGSNTIDKTDKRLTHSSDGLGYYIAERFPAGGVPKVGRVQI